MTGACAVNLSSLMKHHADHRKPEAIAYAPEYSTLASYGHESPLLTFMPGSSLICCHGKSDSLQGENATISPDQGIIFPQGGIKLFNVEHLNSEGTTLQTH